MSQESKGGMSCKTRNELKQAKHEQHSEEKKMEEERWEQGHLQENKEDDRVNLEPPPPPAKSRSSCFKSEVPQKMGGASSVSSHFFCVFRSRNVSLFPVRSVGVSALARWVQFC